MRGPRTAVTVGGLVTTYRGGSNVEKPTTAEVRTPKQKARDLKEPGDTTVTKNGRRYRKLKSGKVVVDAAVWSTLLGRNVWTTHDNVTDAKNWQSNQRIGRVHGQEVDPKLAKQSFAVVAAEWLMSNPAKTPRACTVDKDRLKATGVVLVIEGEGKERKVTIEGTPTGFAARPIGSIKTGHVETLINTWKSNDPPYLPNTIAGMYSSMRTVFSYAEDHEVIPKRSSPCRDVREKPKWRKVERPVHRPDDADLDEYVGVKSVGNDELITLADALGPDYNLSVWLGVCFGLRYEEIFGLTVGSVEGLMQGLVKITQVVDRLGKLRPTTKTEAGDRYIIDRDLNADIMAHMARLGITLNDRPDTLLFVNARTGGPLTYNAWHKIWCKALVKAGLDWKKKNGQRLGLHDLRSMNRSIMRSQAVDDTTARFRFGHADDEMEGIYARTSPAQIRQASERIHSQVRRVPKGQREETEDKPKMDTAPNL
jgi:hypothetical protein